MRHSSLMACLRLFVLIAIHSSSWWLLAWMWSLRHRHTVIMVTIACFLQMLLIVSYTLTSSSESCFSNRFSVSFCRKLGAIRGNFSPKMAACVSSFPVRGRCATIRVSCMTTLRLPSHEPKRCGVGFLVRPGMSGKETRPFRVRRSILGCGVTSFDAVAIPGNLLCPLACAVSSS